MSVVKHLCGSCGAQVSIRDQRCPKCTQPLQWDEGTAGHQARCAVCGFQNPAGSETCQSCGARLHGGEVRNGAPSVSPEQNKKKRTQASTSQNSSTPRRFEPWQVISVVAILGLVGFLLYLELSRQPASSGAMQAGPPPVMQPQMQQGPDIAPFERAVAANPNDPAALVSLANVLHDNGMYPRAIETYQKYLKMKPDDPNARVDMGICYYLLGGQDSIHASMMMATAIKEMETALRGSPRHQPATFNLGVVNLTLGDLEKSRAWFRKAVDLDKSSELGIRAQKMLDQHAFTP